MDDIRQHYLNEGLRAAAELMVCLMQIGLDVEMEQVMDISSNLVDMGAKS